MSAAAPPEQIVMLAFAGVQILDVEGPLQILSGANAFRARFHAEGDTP